VSLLLALTMIPMTNAVTATPNSTYGTVLSSFGSSWACQLFVLTGFLEIAGLHTGREHQKCQDGHEDHKAPETPFVEVHIVLHCVCREIDSPFEEMRKNVSRFRHNGLSFNTTLHRPESRGLFPGRIGEHEIVNR